VVAGLPQRRTLLHPNPRALLVEHTAQISEALATYKSVLAFITSDEESLFDLKELKHRNIRFWQQSPQVGRDYGSARFFGCGFTPHFNQLPAEPPVKDLDLFVSAQRTTLKRNQAFEAIEHVHTTSTFIQETAGFTQGLEPAEYRRLMLSARVAPAPGGPATADTFRLFEALEAHAVPIPDDPDYWSTVLPGHPFPVVSDYSQLPGYIGDVLADWPATANRVAAYWIRYKRWLAHWLREDLEALGAL